MLRRINILSQDPNVALSRSRFRDTSAFDKISNRVSMQVSRIDGLTFIHDPSNGKLHDAKSILYPKRIALGQDLDQDMWLRF